MGEAGGVVGEGARTLPQATRGGKVMARAAFAHHMLCSTCRACPCRACPCRACPCRACPYIPSREWWSGGSGAGVVEREWWSGGDRTRVAELQELQAQEEEEEEKEARVWRGGGELP